MDTDLTFTEKLVTITCSTDNRKKNSGSMKMEIRHDITKN